MVFMRSIFSVLFVFIISAPMAFAAESLGESEGDSEQVYVESEECRKAKASKKKWYRRYLIRRYCNTPVTNTAPTVTITSPEYGRAFEYGNSVDFNAIATDRQDGDLSSKVEWVSSIDGPFRSGEKLSLGNHVITAKVSDAGGLSSSDSTSVLVFKPVENTPPSISIKFPMNGSIIEVGESLGLSATAFDEQDGDLSELVMWRSSLDGTIRSPAQLSVGDHQISAVVVDASGLSAITSVFVSVAPKVVNTAPSVAISSPTNGAVIEEGESLSLSGTATDEQDGNLAESLMWKSSLDGALVNPAKLSVGDHVITAFVVDSEGLSASSTVTVSVTAKPVNTAPSVAISSPTSGTVIEEGQSVSLVGTATDEQDGNLAESLIWKSSLDGSLVNPAMLSVGDHVITAFVVDSEGLSASGTVNVTVTAKAVNTAPRITIISPAEITTIEEGYSLLFEAEAIDAEDGDLSNKVQWTSSLDGAISNIATLSVGYHLVTASVQDAEGLVDEASIEITVTEAVATANPLDIIWDAPMYRDDGSVLSLDDIGGYEIKLVNQYTGETFTFNIADGYANSYTTDPLELGDYMMSMRTYDADGTYSQSTEQVLVTVN